MSKDISVDDFFAQMQNEEKKFNQRASELMRKKRKTKKVQKSVPKKDVKKETIESPPPPKNNTPQHSKQEILQSIQRDINCLFDENRGVRISSLQKLNSLFNTLPKEYLEFLWPHVYQPIIAKFSDPVECIRENSIKMLISFVDLLQDGSELCLQHVIPTIYARMRAPTDVKLGKYVEGSEEVRVLLVTLLKKLVTYCPKKMVDYLDDLKETLKMCYADFHVIKQLSAEVTIDLCKSIPERIHLIAPNLAQHLRQNLVHQRSVVRISSIKALCEVVMCGAHEYIEKYEVLLRKLIVDHSQPVRLTMFETVRHWLLYLDTRYSYHDKLVILVLLALTDDDMNIRVEAFSLMETLGKMYEEDNEKDVKDIKEYGLDEVKNIDNSDILPPPFLDRPRLGSRLLVRDHVRKWLNISLQEMVEWDIHTRRTASKLLQICIIYCEEYITQHIENILSNLFRFIRDEKELDVKKEMIYSVILIGRYVDPDTYIPTIMTHTKPEYAASPDLLATVITTFGYLVKGAKRDVLKNNLSDIANVFTQQHLLYNEHSALLNSILVTLEAIFDSAKDQLVTTVHEYLYIIVQLIAQPPAKPFIEKGKNLVEKLAMYINMSRDELFNTNAEKILQVITRDVDKWDKASPNLHAFDAFIRMSGKAIVNHFQNILPILKKFMDPNTECTVALQLMNLLNYLLVELASTGLIHLHMNTILDFILPNLIWKVGNQKAQLRKVAMSGFSVIVNQKMLNEEQIKIIVKDHMKHIVSCLDEDDPSFRMISISCFGNLLHLTNQYLNDEQWKLICKEVLDRMNDSHDEIRIETAKVYSTIFKYLPFNFPEDEFKNIIKTFIIHLDDMQTQVQEIVFYCLKEAITHQKQKLSIIQKELEEAKPMHRIPDYCENLLQYSKQI